MAGAGGWTCCSWSGKAFWSGWLGAGLACCCGSGAFCPGCMGAAGPGGWALPGLVAGLAAHETGWAELFALAGWALPGLVAGLAAHETGWAELFALGWALPGLVAGLAAHETGWAELFALGWALPGLLAAHETGWAELFALGWALGLPGLPGLAVASVKLLSVPQSPPQVFAHLLWPAVEL